MAPPTSSSSQPPPLPHDRRPHLFTAVSIRPLPIPEREQEEEDEASTGTQHHRLDAATVKLDAARVKYKHRATTPLHPATSPAAAAPAPHKKTHPANGAAEHAVSCNECRPSSREKTSLVPLDAGRGRSRSSSSMPSPGHNGVLRSFFSAFTRRSPRPSCSSLSDGKMEGMAVMEEEWRLAATELSRRLIHATRKRDEALAEASRLKYSVSELERKLARLDSHCRDLRSALDRGTHHRPVAARVGSEDFPLEPFLRAVSDARSAVRRLSRSLAAQMRRDGDPIKAHGRLLQLIQQEDHRGPSGGGAGGSSLLFHLEALLSRAFYEDFELAGFHRGGSDWVVDPRARAEANTAAYRALRGLSWEDVLSRGTRHYSKDFSRFCDRKMGQVAASELGDGRRGAWPEPLLRAFFEAAKGVWLVHLLAWSAHPPVPVFRVERGAPFDAGYMEEVAAPAGGPGPPQAPAATVRMMVAPGFYVEGGVVKCKVLCMHVSNSKGSCDDKEISTTKIRVNGGSGNRVRR